LVEKTIFTYVRSALVDYILVTCTFALWMSKCVHDVFTIVVNFLSNKWEAKYITIRLFEVSDTNGVTMAPRLQQLLDEFSLPKRSLLMLKMRVLIYIHVQVLWTLLFCVLAWLWWSLLMGHVLGMPYQRFVNMPL
jgi:hypothetical protein